MKRAAWRVHRGVLGVEVITAVAALIGGALLASRPDGSLLHADPRVLVGSPFTDWRVPGLLLAGLVGGGYLLTAACAVRGMALARSLTALAGAGLVGFEAAELAWIGPQPMEALFAGVGAVVLWTAIRGPGSARR